MCCQKIIEYIYFILKTREILLGTRDYTIELLWLKLNSYSYSTALLSKERTQEKLVHMCIQTHHTLYVRIHKNV